MPGSFLKYSFPFGACEAKNRRGTQCGSRQVKATKKGRLLCRFHGGACTGPRTPEGKARLRATALANLALTPNWKKKALRRATPRGEVST